MRFGGEWRSRVARWLGRPLAAAVRSSGSPDGVIAVREGSSVIPPDWIEFASLLQERIQLRLNSGDAVATRLQTAMWSQASETGAPPTIALRVWVGPGGRVECVEAEGMQGDLEGDLDCRGLTVALGNDGDVARVPAGMPQPLRMRLLVKSAETSP
ncbi:hypothetical protein [Rhodopseudomonas palustris]|nr:hypothetical protein [Rhodopseudomonas palustris]